MRGGGAARPVTARSVVAAALLGLLGCMTPLVSVGPASAQAPPPAAQAPAAAPSPAAASAPGAGPINAATDVRFDQLLDNQITLSNTFRDEDGKTVPLKSYFGKKPVVLVMPFYQCPGTCTAMLDGMARSFGDEKIKFKLGRDFDAIVVSINPKETPELAAAKKKEYLNLLGIPGAEKGWHFLTGDEANIRKLADEIGYKYKYNPDTDDYAHASGIVVITPDGHISRYFYGVDYPAGQVKLALTEAGRGKIGSPVDQIILYCYHYDPQTGKYGPAIFRIMQVAGLATVLLLGSFMVLAFRREYREGSGGIGGSGGGSGQTGARGEVKN